MRHHLLTGLALVGLFFVTVGCEPKENDKCIKPGDCGDKMFCVEQFCKTPESANAFCKSDARHSARCESDGACTYDSGQCVAGSAADCGESKGCKKDGRCTFDAEAKACRLASTEDCKKSEFCSELKRCLFDEATKACVPGSDEECKAQSDCKLAAAWRDPPGE